METATARLINLELMKNEFPGEQFANVLHQLCRSRSMTSFTPHRSLKSSEIFSILQGKHLLSISSSYETLIIQMLTELSSYLNDGQSNTELTTIANEHESDSNCAIYSVNTACLEVSRLSLPCYYFIL